MNRYFAVKKVKPVEDYKLMLTFSNGEKRIFDMRPYLNKGIFKELRDITLFNTAHVSFDTVEWDNEADFDPEVLYDRSEKIKEKRAPTSNKSRTSVSEPRGKYKKK